jgi:hypothetical protein
MQMLSPVTNSIPIHFRLAYLPFKTDADDPNGRESK